MYKDLGSRQSCNKKCKTGGKFDPVEIGYSCVRGSYSKHRFIGHLLFIYNPCCISNHFWVFFWRARGKHNLLSLFTPKSFCSLIYVFKM